MLPTRLAAGSLVLDPHFDAAAEQLRGFLATGPDAEKLDDAVRWVGEAMSPSVLASELTAEYAKAARGET
ncbi:MAG: hypothetical protein ACSLFF_04495 [Solirubrobacterales bacterium]